MWFGRLAFLNLPPATKLGVGSTPVWSSDDGNDAPGSLVFPRVRKLVGYS